MNTIISKLPTTHTYTKWTNTPGGYVREYSILINGGAGVVGGNELLSFQPSEKRSLFIPEGVATEVDDETLAKLEAIGTFQRDVKSGVIVVIKGKKGLTQDKIDTIADNDMVDKSKIEGRPISAEDIEATGASFTEDGAIEISKAKDASPKELRKALSGATGTEKKRVRGAYKASVRKG